MPDFVVKQTFKANDRVTPAFKRMSKGADRFGKKSQSAFQKATKGALGFKAIVGGILTAGVISRAFNAMAEGVRGVTNEFVDFDDAITSAAAKLNVQRGTEQFKTLEKTAREIGATTEFTAAQSARAIDELVKAGFNQEQAMLAAASTTDLATIAAMDLAESTAIGVKALNSFNLAAEDPAERLANLTRVNNVFSRTVNSASTDLQGLFDTMKFAGAVVNTAGGELEDFATLAGAVSRASLEGTLAGTTMRKMFTSLAAPTKEGARQLKKMKVNAVDPVTKAMRKPIEIFTDFAKATEKMSDAQRLAAIKMVFGQRAIVGVSKVLELGGEWLDDYKNKTIASGRTAREVADDMRKSIGNRLRVLKSTAIETGFKFLDIFKDQIPGAITFTVEALRGIKVQQLATDMRNLKDNVITGLTRELRLLAEVLDALKPIMIGFTVAVAMAGAPAFLAGIAGLKAFFALKIFGWALGLKALWGLMLANPIGVFVVALASVVAVVVQVVKNWEFLKVTFLEIVDSVGAAIGDLLHWLGKLIAAGGQKVADFLGIDTEAFKKMNAGLNDFIKKRDAARLGTHAGQPGPQHMFDADYNELFREQLPTSGPRTAPNNAEVEARQKQTELMRGKLTIAGAPPGSTFQDEMPVPPIGVEMLGANP